ncbi:hypothetical protein OSB04_023915 [Centaurea solstitialis]|uniref:Uncharacterized protein n=1 Tax=Centaurea solstitialis TaxID=347529 RepID=A0AA38T4P1_9ASTR|nr:hypothetical protein OSB04_023915 [Centaurea solstitialis]
MWGFSPTAEVVRENALHMWFATTSEGFHPKKPEARCDDYGGDDLRGCYNKSADIYCDNSGAVAQAKEPREHHKSRHVLRKFHLIREIIGRGDVRICKIPTEENVADPLTKPLARVKHE